MSFGLLAPLALALGALLALPVLAHMARQTPRDRQPFGAMLLLQRVVKRLRRRRRVKDPLLLALRLLALVAILLAMAGPRLRYPGGIPEFGGSGRVVVILDRSMSMSLLDGGSTLLQRARERAIAMVGGLPDGALVGLVVYDTRVIRLTSNLTGEHDRVIAQLEAVQPSHGTSDLRGALLEARRLLGGEVGEILLFTDEAGPRTVEDAKGEIARLVESGVTIVPQVIQGDPPRNVAITSAAYGDGVEGGEVTVRIASYGPDPIEVACEIELPDGAIIPIFADLPPAGEAEERVTVPPEARGGVGAARCVDPDLPADDARYFHLPRVGASRVLVVDGDPGDTPTRSEIYFLEKALAPWGGVRTGVTIDVTTPVGLLGLEAEAHRVVFLANVPDPRPFGPRLTEFVRRGGNLVLTGGDNVTAERYNAALGSVLPAPLRKARSVADVDEEGVPVAMPDADLDLFRPFTRAGRSGFGRVRSHTLLTFDGLKEIPDEVRVLLEYENGMPALVERRVGPGRVLVWTGTFDYAWGNLPLQAVFMPMMQRLVAYLGAEAGNAATRLDSLAGQTVTVPLPDLVLEPSVTGPSGEPVRSRIEGSKLLFTPELPGAYAVGVEDSPTMVWVAVNNDPDESDVRPYASVARVEHELRPELLERTIDLSRPSLALGLLLLVAQGVCSLCGGQP